MGRGHLKDVCRKAFFNAEDVDDSDEILSYRVAVGGALASLSFAGVWLYLSGMPPLVALLFLLSAFAIFVALTRIVAESGVPEARTPMNAAELCRHGDRHDRGSAKPALLLSAFPLLGSPNCASW